MKLIQTTHFSFIVFLKAVFFSLLLAGCGEKKPKLTPEEVAKIEEEKANKSRYLPNLPLDVLQVAEEFKQVFVESKLADQAVSENDLKPTKLEIRQQEINYEEAINVLYEQGKSDKEAFEQVLLLIKYAPTLFDNKKMRELLAQKSPLMADFAVHYIVQTAMSNADTTKELESASKAKDQVIAEQQAKITNLNGRVSSLKNRLEGIESEIEDMKKASASVQAQLKQQAETLKRNQKQPDDSSTKIDEALKVNAS